MKLKRMLALLLAACMLLGALAGCSKTPANTDPDTPKPTDSTKPNGNKADNTAQTSAKYVYVADEMDFNLPVEYVEQTCVSGDFIYAVGSVMTDPGSGTPDYSIDTADAASSTFARAEAADASSDTASEEASADTEAVREPDAIIDDPIPGGEPVTDDPAPIDDSTDQPVADEPAIDEPADGGDYVAPTYETRIYRIDMMTGAVEELDCYTAQTAPEGYQGNSYISAFLPGTDGSIWIYDVLSSYTYNLPDDFDPNNDYEWNYYEQGPVSMRLQQFSKDGELLNTVPLDALASDETSSIDVSFIDEKGNIFVTDYNTYSAVDVTGKVIKTFEMGENGGSITGFCGQAAIQTWSDSETLQLIDPDTLEVGEAFNTPVNGWNYLKSYDEAYDFYYIYNSNLYGYKTEEQESEKVVDWMDCDVDPSNLTATYSLPDGRIVGLFSEWNESTNGTRNYCVFLTKTDASNVKQKTVLTLACMYLPWDLRNKIIAFNKASDSYRIIVNDYSQYATADDYNAGITKLNTEIISGKIPDLLYTNSMPIQQYAGQGVLVDLLPLIDADSELSRDDLMTNVLDAACINGHLYQAADAFTINTAIGLTKVVGDYDKWTLTELNDAMTKLQSDASVFGKYYTRESVFSDCMRRNLSYFVNWETGECSFDSQEFRDLLEFVKTFPQEVNQDDTDDSANVYGAAALRQGLQLLMPMYLYSVDSLLWDLSDFGDEPTTYIGYPSQEGNCSTFSLSDGLAITTACADQDGAWQFVRQLFTEEYQTNSYNGIPTNKNLFQKQLEAAQTIEYQTDENGQYVLDENGEKIVIPKASIWDDETQQNIDIDCMSKEQADALMALYNSIHTCSNYDAEVTTVVTNETAGYFAGQTTLDECVKRIQNRVSLYVAEQK